MTDPKSLYRRHTSIAPSALLIQPITQGGVSVNNLGSVESINTIQISNDRRRPAWVFIEHLRDHVEDDLGARVIEYNDLFFDSRLDSVTGLGGTISTFADIASGDLAYTPVDLDPIFIPNPENPDVVKREYRVIAVGPGADQLIAFFEEDLTDEMLSKWLSITFEWLIGDVFLPIMSASLPDLDGFTAGPGGLQAFAVSIGEGLCDQILELLPLIWEGRYDDALDTIFTSIVHDDSLLEYILNEFVWWGFGGEAVGSELMESWVSANSALGSFFNALKIADFALGAYDIGAVLTSVYGVSPAMFWEIDVIPPTVTLSPSIKTVPAAMSATFTATVRDAGEPITENLRHNWELVDGQGKGVLRANDMSQGQQLMTTANSIRFVAAIDIEEEEEIELKCTVSQFNSILNRWLVLGAAKSQITVTPNRGEAELFSLLDVWINDRGGTSFIYRVGVRFPKVPGATRYRVTGRDFYDERYYGDSFSFTGAGDNWTTPVNIPERLQAQRSSQYEYMPLAGGSYSGSASGTPPDPNERVQGALARFEGGVFEYQVIEVDPDYSP